MNEWMNGLGDNIRGHFINWTCELGTAKYLGQLSWPDQGNYRRCQVISNNCWVRVRFWTKARGAFVCLIWELAVLYHQSVISSDIYHHSQVKWAQMSNTFSWLASNWSTWHRAWLDANTWICNSPVLNHHHLLLKSLPFILIHLYYTFSACSLPHYSAALDPYCIPYSNFPCIGATF